MVTNSMRQTSLRKRSSPPVGKRRRKSSGGGKERRMLMRDWLINVADLGQIKGLEWVDAKRTLLKVPWKHASRRGWLIEQDACIFHAWAMYTGKVNEDGSNPKKWKANFRCAMNSLPDVLEERDLGHRNGDHAYRVYRFYGPNEKPAVKQRRESRVGSNSDGWSTCATRAGSTDSERDECARAVAGIQRNDSIMSSSSSGSHWRPGVRQVKPRRGHSSSSSYSSSDETEPFVPVHCSNKDVPACVEEVIVTSTTGGCIEMHDDVIMEQPIAEQQLQQQQQQQQQLHQQQPTAATAVTTNMFEEFPADDFKGAMVPLMVEEFTEPDIPMPPPPPSIPPIGTFVYNKPKLTTMPVTDTMSNTVYLHQPLSMAWCTPVSKAINRSCYLPQDVAAEFGVPCDKITVQGTGVEFGADDEDPTIRRDVSLQAVMYHPTVACIRQ